MNNSFTKCHRLMQSEITKAMSLPPAMVKHAIEANRLDNLKANNPVKFDKAVKLTQTTVQAFDYWFKQDENTLDSILDKMT